MAQLYDPLVLLLCVALTIATLFAIVALGPNAQRSVRLTMITACGIAFLCTAFWLITYFGLVDQRQSIEKRLSELRAQALSVGASLACLEQAADRQDAACATALFNAPEALAAANFFTADRLDVLDLTTRYRGPRNQQFDQAVAALERSLAQDPFGLTAHALTERANCTSTSCNALATFADPSRVRENLRRKTYDANLVKYASNWRSAPAIAPYAAALPEPIAAATASISLSTPALQTTQVSQPPSEKPVSDKYDFPSASSIPPVSIMNDEPAERAAPSPGPTSERALRQRQPVPDATPAHPTGDASPQQTATPPSAAQPKTAAVKASGGEKRMAPRREKPGPNVPMSIAPTP